MTMKKNFTFKKCLTILLVKYATLLKCLAILIVGLSFYFCTRNLGLSTNSKDWGDFGSYLSGIVGLANLYLFYQLTIKIQEYNEINDRPLLSFFKNSDDKDYTLENIGKGTAINVKVGASVDDSEEIKEKHYYSFSPNTAKKIDWTKNCQSLYAQYQDVFGNTHEIFMRDDTLFEITSRTTEKNIKHRDEIKLYQKHFDK